MPHSNSPFPLGKGGMPYGKKSKSSVKIWYGLTVHICFLIYLPTIYYVSDTCHGRERSGNSSESSRIHSIRPHHSRMMQNLHHLFTHYILCFRCLTIGREPSEIPANQVKFAPFTHKFHELREFCAFHTKIHPHLVHYFQNRLQRTPGNWSESTRFHTVRPQLSRITRNLMNPHHDQLSRSESRELQKYTANDASSAPFAQHLSKSREICDICKQNTR